MKKLEVGVIGLGKFGMQLARTLASLGHTVVGVDGAPSKVQFAQDILDKVYRADASDIVALKELGFQHFDYVVVSVGQAMELSLTITLNLQEMGVRSIWVKSTSLEHRKILKRLGVQHAILPEHDTATMTAYHLNNPGMIDLIPKYGGILVQELVVENWAGKKLMELNLMNEHEVIVLAVQLSGSKEFTFVPKASTLLSAGDTIVVVGKMDNVNRLKP